MKQTEMARKSCGMLQLFSLNAKNSLNAHNFLQVLTLHIFLHVLIDPHIFLLFHAAKFAKVFRQRRIISAKKSQKCK